MGAAEKEEWAKETVSPSAARKSYVPMAGDGYFDMGKSVLGKNERDEGTESRLADWRNPPGSDTIWRAGGRTTRRLDGHSTADDSCGGRGQTPKRRRRGESQLIIAGE